MSNQKAEGTPRSESFFQSAARRPFFPEPGYYLPIIDENLLELARLFATEEALALRIQDDEQAVNKETIYEVVTLARKIAKAGFHTTLVPTNEMLDIAQIFCAKNPDGSEQIQRLHHHRRMLSWPRFSKDNLELLLAQVTYPDSETAGAILIDLLASLENDDNPAWTARVAAALAYYSTSED